MQSNSGITVTKLVLTAMLACLSFVLSTFVHFPSMAPFQHCMNVITAVLLGPYYGFAAAFLTGVLRVALWGRPITAIVGAVIGAFLSGLLYRKTQRLLGAVVGEIIGTGILSALASYPIMRLFFGLPEHSPFYYIPFFLPSALAGSLLGYGVLLVLQRSHTLHWMQQRIHRQRRKTA